MLLAEELLLLLIRKKATKWPPFLGTRAALAAAVLVELAETGQLSVTDGRVTRNHGDEHPLAPALDGTTIDMAITYTGIGLYPALLTRLTDQGVLARGRNLAGHTWQPTDEARRTALFAELTAVLADDVPATMRTGALIGLLHALDLDRKLMPGLRPAGLFRAAWLAKESWPVNAVARTVAACRRKGDDLPGIVRLAERWP